MSYIGYTCIRFRPNHSRLNNYFHWLQSDGVYNIWTWNDRKKLHSATSINMYGHGWKNLVQKVQISDPLFRIGNLHLLLVLQKFASSLFWKIATFFMFNSYSLTGSKNLCWKCDLSFCHCVLWCWKFSKFLTVSNVGRCHVVVLVLWST